MNAWSLPAHRTRPNASGMGLALVQLLSLGWGVIHGPTRVWLQLPCATPVGVIRSG